MTQKIKKSKTLYVVNYEPKLRVSFDTLVGVFYEITSYDFNIRVLIPIYLRIKAFQFARTIDKYAEAMKRVSSDY